jgi:hypothetical protein
VQIFFRVVNAYLRAPKQPQKRGSSAHDAREFFIALRDATSYKPAFHRRFLSTQNFSAPAHRRKSFSPRVFSDAYEANAFGKRGAALTHKIKWNHCYFFPAVVIGR